MATLFVEVVVTGKPVGTTPAVPFVDAGDEDDDDDEAEDDEDDDEGGGD